MPGTGAVFSQKFTMNFNYYNFAALTSIDGAEEKGYGKLTAHLLIIILIHYIYIALF